MSVNLKTIFQLSPSTDCFVLRDTALLAAVVFAR